jgi:hypothetical protein
VEALNEQIVSEFAASQQYIAIAVHYDQQTLRQLATRFYRQAVEERNHALMIVQYLLDSGASPLIPAVEAEERLEGVVVVLVHQHGASVCMPEPLRGTRAGEASAEDEHPRPRGGVRGRHEPNMAPLGAVQA